jgi:hypothetical protein
LHGTPPTALNPGNNLPHFQDESSLNNNKLFKDYGTDLSDEDGLLDEDLGNMSDDDKSNSISAAGKVSSLVFKMRLRNLQVRIKRQVSWHRSPSTNLSKFVVQTLLRQISNAGYRKQHNSDQNL